MQEPFTHFMNYAVNFVRAENSLDIKAGAMRWT